MLGPLLSSLRRLARRPLRVQVAGGSLSFATPGDFEFALESRTEYPAHRLGELLRTPAADLERMALRIRQVETYLGGVLSRAARRRVRLGDVLRALDPRLFSQDHQWRELMEKLAAQGSGHDEFRRVALSAYLRYLRSRRQVVETARAENLAARSAGAHPERGRGPGPAGHRPRGELSFTDTGIFEAGRADAPDPHADGYVRLPRGAAVEVLPRAGEPLRLLLGEHPFTLVPGTPPYLADALGERRELRRGPNRVGRRAGSDVPVAPDRRSVSRDHLVVEVLGGGRVRLTDLSSQGTFVPRSRAPADL